MLKLPAILGFLWIILLVIAGLITKISFYAGIVFIYLLLLSLPLSFLFIVWSLVAAILSIKEKNTLWAILNFILIAVIIILFALTMIGIRDTGSGIFT